MKMLTYKNGEKVCFKQEFESVDEAIGVMAFALFAREEMERKRKEGCDFCNGPCNLSESYTYCPNCGRKLVE